MIAWRGIEGREGESREAIKEATIRDREEGRRGTVEEWQGSVVAWELRRLRVLEEVISPARRNVTSIIAPQVLSLRWSRTPRHRAREPLGVLTNDIVYKRLAPGVLEQLKRVTPRTDRAPVLRNRSSVLV